MECALPETPLYYYYYYCYYYYYYYYYYYCEIIFQEIACDGLFGRYVMY